MGLRKDLDKISVRFIYYLIYNEKVLYVGTAKKPVNRYKNHIKKIKENNPAPIYQYCIKNKITPKLKVILKLTTTYNQAELIEIEHIKKHQDTCLNFYNNPNKKKVKKYMIKNKKQRKNNENAESSKYNK